jgi:hypothetical protein
MRAHWIAAASLLGLLAGCTGEGTNVAQVAANKVVAAKPHALSAAVGAATARIGALADRGELARYDAAAPTVRRGATTWHPVELSEAHARNAIGGELVVAAPDGKPIRLKYASHVDHGDGNWTWVGRPEGAQPGTEAILTFGPKAVFGAIPNGTHPLELTMAKGRTWMAETDLARADAEAALTPPADDDFVLGNADGVAASIAQSAKVQAPAAIASRKFVTAGMKTESATPSATTVDLMVGYSAGLTARVGGVSQAITRLNNVVDIANQAYANSMVGMQLRMVHAMQVDFADTSSNRSALFALTGVACTTGGSGGQLPDGSVNCGSTPRPAALQALVGLRDMYGADLVTLVRATSPEQGSCGIAWLAGTGGTALENYVNSAFSVVSDSTGATSGTICRPEALAHELGHNMGLQHDRVAAANADGDGVLDPEEFGSRGWSFGYVTDSTNGNFSDIMGVRTGGQTLFRVFSNPRIIFCGGRACGDGNLSDNALALSQNIPTIAAYKQGVTAAVGAFSRDVDGNHKDDFMWFNPGTHEIYSWFMNGATPVVGTSGGFGPASTLPQAAADFNNDGRADIVFSNGITVQMYLGNGSGGFTPAANDVGSAPAGNVLLAAADFDNNNTADLLWLNPVTGGMIVWTMNGATVTSSANAGSVLGGTAALAAGDFNNDHRVDVLLASNEHVYMMVNSPTGFTYTYVTPRPAGWQLLATQDINANGTADALWYNSTTRELYYWLMNGNVPVSGRGGTFAIGGTAPITAGDYNGDGRMDIVLSSGENVYMYMANAGGTFDASFIAATPIGWNML